MHRRINYLQTKERQQEFEIGALLSETEKLARKVANLEAQTSNSSSSSKRRTIGYLQERLKDMLEAVGSLESPTKSSNSSKSMPMPADHLLAEMQEQLKLQKELHLRRKELEELMKKDLLEQSQMNEQRCGPPDSKDVSRWLIDTSLLASHPFFQQHSPPMSRQMSMSSSSFIPESNTTEEQLRSLQSQIDTLMADVRTLSTALQLQHNSSKGYTTEHLLVLYNRQEEKIQHLNQTVQRCLQELQRLNEVVPSLQNSVEKMIRQRMQSEQNRMNVEGEMGHWQDVNSSWPFQVAHSLSALNGNRHSDVDPSQNEVALNNQVLPGIRANNYWDLSRSFRYVNRLPNATSPGPIMTSAGSNVAQVSADKSYINYIFGLMIVYFRSIQGNTKVQLWTRGMTVLRIWIPVSRPRARQPDPNASKTSTESRIERVPPSCPKWGCETEWRGPRPWSYPCSSSLKTTAISTHPTTL